MNHWQHFCPVSQELIWSPTCPHRLGTSHHCSSQAASQAHMYWASAEDWALWQRDPCISPCGWRTLSLNWQTFFGPCPSQRVPASPSILPHALPSRRTSYQWDWQGLEIKFWGKSSGKCTRVGAVSWFYKEVYTLSWGWDRNRECGDRGKLWSL